MSDFFYKEKFGPMFSPVIKVKHENISPTVVSAIDNLLSPSGNMFTRAETVRKLMSLESMSLEETAKALSLKKTDVANKLRLLEFSPKERSAILEYGYSESSALQFLRLDKIQRLYAIEYCHGREFDSDAICEYVEELVGTTVKGKKGGREEADKKSRTVKFSVGDIRFFINSVENAIRLARKAGFDVKDEQSEDQGGYDIHIRVDKNKNK